MDTKLHYVSSFRQWVTYCISINENPLKMPIDSELAAYWIADRTNQMGNIKSFCTWQSMLCWLCEIKGYEPSFKSYPFYSNFIKSLKKEYFVPSDSRLPFEINHIINFTKYYNVVGKNATSVDFDILLKIILIQIYFFTMSRPSELLKSQRSKNKPGIKISDIIHKKVNNPHHCYFKLLIKSYKNQKFKKQYKTIIIGDSHCNQMILDKQTNCICKFLNLYQLLKLYLVRRHKLSNIECNTKIKFKLSLNPKNNLFIWKSGKDVSTNDLSNLVKEMTNILNIPESPRYAPYSLRIGGTTLASIKAIPYPKILRYVGWSANNLPNVSMRYIRYKENDFRIMIYQMIHGITPQIANIQQQQRSGVIYDPWTFKWDQHIKPLYKK